LEFSTAIGSPGFPSNKTVATVMRELEPGFPLIGIERGYFLDIQHFFGERKLLGFKVLCAPCNLRCYYCHRSPFIGKGVRAMTHDEVVREIEKWSPYNIMTFTGGEITLVAEPTAALMDSLRSSEVSVLFSTNGVLSDKVEYLTKHANLVKIDVKGSERLYDRVAGLPVYRRVMESVGICAARLPTEVKVLLHSFTEQEDIESVLRDLKAVTGFPDNLIVEFQLVKDFLGLGIEEPNGQRIRKICSRVSPLPEAVLLKEYGSEEVIEELTDGEWRLYRKKEIPLRFNW